MPVLLRLQGLQVLTRVAAIAATLLVWHHLWSISPPERRRVAHTLEPSVARTEQALAATDRSCMLERHCRRMTTVGRGGRGGRGSRGGTWLLLLTELARSTRALEDNSLKRLL
jgi:hypothetical protein